MPADRAENEKRSEKNETEKKLKEFPQEEIGPIHTTLVDTFWLTYSKVIMKMTFGETVEGGEYWRIAVAMPLTDAEVLANRILEAIKEMKDPDAKKG